MKRGKTIALPRPPRTHRANRVEVRLTMHPSRLALLEERAAAASMSLTAYVDALLASDPEDVPAIANRPRSIWSELTTGPQEPLLVSGRNKAVETFVAEAHARGEMMKEGCACATCMARELDGPSGQKGE